MAYCTQQDMIDRYGEEELIQLTDREQTGAIDTAVLSAAIDDATGTMDAYLGTRYTLPLASVPAALKRICCDMARYLLHGNAAPETVADRNGAAIEFLQAVAKGDLDLAVGNTSQNSGGVAFEPGTAAFGETENWP